MVPAELLRRHALLLGGDDVERQDRQHRAVHGHRHAHLVERDAGEQDAHVEDRVDRDAGHADVAGDARVVAVVAAVGGEVEGDRQALLPGREVAAVERVGSSAVENPAYCRMVQGWVDVHGRVRPAQKWRQARIGVEEIEAVQVALSIEWTEPRCLRAWTRAPARGWQPRARGECLGSGRAERGLGEAWDRDHMGFPASTRCARCKVARMSVPR